MSEATEQLFRAWLRDLIAAENVLASVALSLPPESRVRLAIERRLEATK